MGAGAHALGHHPTQQIPCNDEAASDNQQGPIGRNGWVKVSPNINSLTPAPAHPTSAIAARRSPIKPRANKNPLKGGPGKERPPSSGPSDRRPNHPRHGTARARFGRAHQAEKRIGHDQKDHRPASKPSAHRAQRSDPRKAQSQGQRNLPQGGPGNAPIEGQQNKAQIQ